MNYFAWFSRSGFLRRSGPEGRLVVDSWCASDLEHLLAPAMDANGPEPRRMCRVFLDEVVPEEWIGKKGRVVVTVELKEGD